MDQITARKVNTFMENTRSYKLAGYNSVIAFSADARYILIGGYDGGFKVFDTSDNKIRCKFKLKGPKSDIDIRHMGISHDNRYVAFSALWKVFLMDMQKEEIIWEFEFSKAERRTSSPFCFFNTSLKLAIPNGSNMLIYDIEAKRSEHIELPTGAGWTDCLAVSPDDSLVAYKSCNGEHEVFAMLKKHHEPLDDKVFVYDAKNGKLKNTIKVPYPSVRGAQISISGIMKFVSAKTLLVQRKATGLSYFNADTGAEEYARAWKDIIGVKTIYSFRDATISADGRCVLFNKETPTEIRPDGSWVIPIPEGLEYVLLDVEANKILYRQKSGEDPATFHFETKRLAHIKREYDENHRRTDYLCVVDIS